MALKYSSTLGKQMNREINKETNMMLKVIPIMKIRIEKN